MRNSLLLMASAFALISPAALLAQDEEQGETPATDPGDSELEDDELISADGRTIIVSGTRLRGQLAVEEPPLAEFDEADIAAFGAGSIEDVLAAIEPATNSGARGGRGGGRPVFLINGIRVSSWREFRSYPPEAVAKVEVFSEEIAQRFGYSANQRVVNIVLKPDFRSVTAEVEYAQPDRGGYSRNEQELTFLRIGEKGRLNFNAEFDDTSLLTEAERGLGIDGDLSAGEARSLIADGFSAEATANYARAFIESGASFSLNGTYERSESRSLAGLANNGFSVLDRERASDTFSIGSSLNKPLGDWISTLTVDASRVDATTRIDRRDASGFDVARSLSTTVDSKATFTGYPLQLPAGEVSTTIDLNLDWTDISSSDTRSDADIDLDRLRMGAGLNVSVPVAESGGPLGALGGISLNLTGGIDDLSDFGTLANASVSLNWRPTEKLSLSATRIWREVAPTLLQLGSPRIDEFNVPVFDYRSGETEFVTQITGGNPDLLAETQTDWKFGANWQLPFWEDARIGVDYGMNRSRDVTQGGGFSAAYEEAFPDRVTRGDNGELLAIDRRPLTLYETRSRILSFGFNASGQIGKTPERPERGEGRGPGAGGENARGGSGGAGGFDPARMAALRDTFCNTPEGEMPDLSQIPEQFRARLLDADGNPDPEKIAQARQRFCGEEAQQRSEQFTAMREAICADPPRLDGLPDEVLARLRNEDGEIDPEKLKAMRERMCSADGAAAGGEGRGGGRRGRGGGGRFGGGDDGDTRPRYFFSLNHNILLENEILLAENGPLFDQVDGESLGGAAVPRNTSRLEGGIFWQGYGMRLSGRYTGEAFLRGSDLAGSSDLFFGDLVTFDVRLFADLGEIFEREEGWMKGLRVSLMADNIFDTRREVTDENGVTPEAYDRFRIDPTGRYLGFDIRKAF